MNPDNSQSNTTLSLWRNMIIYSLFVYIVVALYYFVQRGTFSLFIANRVAADVSILLIGLSFALSGLCYFWNFADHFIIYRKHLGVIGFIYALFHTYFALFMSSRAKPYVIYYLQEDRLIPFLSAVIAIIMYAGMVYISRKSMVQKLGGKLWRQLLRLGYIAYALSILHFGMLLYTDWLEWLLGGGDSLFPPFSIFVFVAGVSVIVLRIALWISRLKNSTQTANEQTNSQPLQEERPNTV